MRKALLDRDREAGINQAPKTVDTRPKVVLTPPQKRARCRDCTIYLEHQRQKFKIASPVTMVSVLVIYAALYGWLYDVLYEVLKRTDRFMSFLTYHKDAASSFASQGHTVTTLATICLGVVLLSFTLRFVEWLIFDMQV
jgi:hypothetical protein